MASKNIQNSLIWLRNFFKILWLKVVVILKNFLNCENKTKETDFELKNDQKIIHPIPEVKGLPFVGTFFDLIAAGAAPKLHLYIDKRHQEYGNIFRERLGGTQDAIFVSSANLMRSVFLNEGSYPKHPLPEAWILYNKENDCQRGLFFMDGEEWFHNRRILSRILLSGNLNWMDWHIRQCTNKLIQKWNNKLKINHEKTQRNSLEIENLEKHLYRWSIDVIISVMFGDGTDLEIKPIKKTIDDFANIVHKIFKSSSALMNFPPKLAKMFGLKIWSEFELNVQQVLLKGYEIIDLFLERTSAYPGGLYEKLKEAETTLEMIKRIFVDLVIAAGDTTAFATTWSIYLLSQDAKLQQKLYEEHNPNTHDTPLVRGLVKETLRLYPVAPFIGRYLQQECMIENYHIEKNSLVLLSLFTAGRDPKHFPEPLKVMPERWLRNEETGDYLAVYEPNATLPFALGNRSCIGRKLAINQMQYIIAEMSKHFHMECLNTTPIDSILRLVTVPNQSLNISISKRME